MINKITRSANGDARRPLVGVGDAPNSDHCYKKMEIPLQKQFSKSKTSQHTIESAQWTSSLSSNKESMTTIFQPYGRENFLISNSTQPLRNKTSN